MLSTFSDRPLRPRGGAATLFCAALLVADAAHAARHGASHAKRAASHAATPALDAQAIDNAQFSAPAGKGRERAPSAATIIKEEILLDRADFSPGEIDGVAGSNDKKALAAFQQSLGVDLNRSEWGTGREQRPFRAPARPRRRRLRRRKGG